MNSDEIRHELGELLKRADVKSLSNEGRIICGLAAILERGKMRTIFDDVRDFHRKFGIGYEGKPRALPAPLRRFRRARAIEEHEEYLQALDKQDLAKEFDACIDKIYIDIGTMYVHGWDIDEGWRRVHGANMAKVRATPENPGKYGSADDIVKPLGWVAPSLGDLV